ncbi:MAG: leucine-rich repeat domain-containing protein [Prevotella sp.]|nr:leucine-rich repeat domain-containing protein [Prevotella sp.]
MKRINMIRFALMALFCLSVTGISADTWLDHKANGYDGGNGSESNPYIIKTAEQLAFLSYKVNEGESYTDKFFKIDADIDLSAYTWVAIGKYNKTFKGTLKDDGTHVIRGLNIINSEDDYMGLFGLLDGNVEGIHLTGVRMSNTSSISPSIGAVCGNMKPADGNKVRYIKNCVVDDGEITCDCISGDVGGIAGEAKCVITGCVAKVKVNGTSMNCGGIVGKYWGTLIDQDRVSMEDCHAVVNINIKGEYIVNSASRVGGIIGYCYLESHETIAYCSASGQINTKLSDDNFYALAGGLVGYSGGSNLDNCVSAVTLSGGTYIGGVIASTVSASQGTTSSHKPVTVTNSFFSGKIATDSHTLAAGGLVGYLYDTYATRSDWRCCIYLTNSVFGGTYEQSSKIHNNFVVGCLIGKCPILNVLNTNRSFNDLVYDRNMCNLSPCGSGTIEEGVESKLTKELASQEAGGQLGYEYCYMMPRDIIAQFSDEHGDKEIAFKDNYILSSIPLYVSEGKRKSSFAAYYITTPFSLAPLQSNLTYQELATFTLPNNVTFVEYDEKDRTRVLPLDPGKTDVTVTLSGTDLSRKIHLNIAYGEEWNDNEPKDIFIGDGSKDAPFLIQNVSQLAKAAADENKNRPDAYFQLANDIFMNTHLIQKDESIKEGAKSWTPVKWVANLDGNGKCIYGMYVNNSIDETITRTYNDATFTLKCKGGGLFSLLEGQVYDMAIVDSYVSSSGYTGLFCGVMSGEASLKRCMGHGINDVSDFGAGLVGVGQDIDTYNTYYSSNQNVKKMQCGLVEDCFSCVHVEFGLSYYKQYGYRKSERQGSGRGLSGVIAHARRCFSTGKVENFSTRQGITSLPDGADWKEAEQATWYFDNQQMTNEIQTSASRGAHVTSELITGDLLDDDWSAWKEEKGRYPMLKQFADTPYGDILSMPVLFADGDRTGRVSKIFEFPTEEVTWGALNGDTYVDMINECGAASPMRSILDETSEYIFAESNRKAKSECSKALRVMAIETSLTGPVGIEFKDAKCEEAWLEVFNSGKDESEQNSVVTLRNAVESNAMPEGRRFNVLAKEKGVEYFPEMRFFTGIKTLTTGVLSGLDKLCEVELPKALNTISENAFDGCTSLTQVTIPSFTTTIAPGTFDNCPLKDFEVTPQNETFEVRSNALFTLGTADLVAYPSGREESEVTISGSIGEIYNHAFYKIPLLNDIYFDNAKPTGTVPYLYDESIVHYDSDNGTMMDVYVNDGTFDVTYDESTAGNYDGVLMKEYIVQDAWRTFKNAGKLHRYFPLTITDDGWTTLYIGFSTKLPSALKAYRVNKESDYDLDENTTSVTLKRVSNLLHYLTPVAINGAPGTYLLVPYERSVEQSEKSKNWLQGTPIGADGRGGYEYGMRVYQSDANEGSILTLGQDSQGALGFYYYNSPDDFIPPFTCYLPYNGAITDGSSHTNMARFSVIIDDVCDNGIPTNINRIADGDIRTTVVYDLLGRKIYIDPKTPVSSQLPKGVYIINGRKMTVN